MPRPYRPYKIIYPNQPIIADIDKGKLSYPQIAKKHKVTFSHVMAQARRFSKLNKASEKPSKYDHMQLITDKATINDWLKQR